MTLWEPEREQAAWYKLQVTTADGGLLWSQTAAEYHVGWTSVFAYREDGTDYLLRYNPWMGQGMPDTIIRYFLWIVRDKNRFFGNMAWNLTSTLEALSMRALMP